VPTKQNGGISADGKTITWRLRKGSWSDGAPFTADDVVFSSKLILDPKTNVVSHDGWDQIVKVDEPNKYTVVYHLKAPYGAFAYTFFRPAMRTRDSSQTSARRKNVNTDSYNALPVGIGPNTRLGIAATRSNWLRIRRTFAVCLGCNASFTNGSGSQHRPFRTENARTRSLDASCTALHQRCSRDKGIKTLLTPSYFTTIWI
jgi:hypothetical protein